MRHAYLIMAHSDFYLLQKLIQAIDNPDGDIFLHLDAKNKYSREDSLWAIWLTGNTFLWTNSCRY